MKRNICKILFPLIAAIILLIIFNMNVYTKQGVNYQWSSIKIPLYLKVLDFFDRHYNYKALVYRITADASNKEEAAMKIFKWTFDNIKKTPEDFPIIDDHVWHIIIRGYGVEDQFSDVFTTLCNYAGINGFYLLVNDKDSGQRIPLSFVEIKGAAYVFDPYWGVYFETRDGRLADIELLRSGKEYAVKTLGEESKIDYPRFLMNLSTVKFNELRRANIQSPVKRLIFQINKLTRH